MQNVGNITFGIVVEGKQTNVIAAKKYPDHLVE